MSDKLTPDEVVRRLRSSLQSPVVNILDCLDRGGYDPRPTGPGAWESRCPAHGGQRHNLSIKRGDDGRILIHCHHQPGCDPVAILAPLGMTIADLFPRHPDPNSHRGNGKPKGERRAHQTPEAALAKTIRERGNPTAFWIYRNADCSEAFRVYRFDFVNSRTGEPDKEFRPIHPTPSGWVVGDPPDPLPLYHLPELARASRVFVTEGEKASDLARNQGVEATTSSHGAKSPHKSDWSPLVGKEVILLPDNDPEGEGYVRNVAPILARLEPRPRVKIVRLADLWRTAQPIPEGGDIEEWLADGVPDSWTDAECRAELERLADGVPEIDLDSQPHPRAGTDRNPAPLGWPDDPRPVRYDMPPVPSLEPEMIPDPLRGWLTDIAERISCPLEFPTVGALAALGIVVGRKIAIRPKRHDDWTVVPNLWGGIVGRPGVMKTPALNEAIRPLRRLEAEARESHAQARKTFLAELYLAQARSEAAKSALKTAAKGKKTEAEMESLARAVALAEEPVEPVLRRYTTSDTTIEALGELLRDNPNIAVIRDELTGWLRSLEKPDRGPDRSFYLEAWDGTGNAFQYDRIGRGHILIPNPTVSILGGIQPGPLRLFVRMVAKGEDADDGLISRLQLFVWPDIAGEWRNVDRWPETAAKNRAFSIFKALDSLTSGDIGAVPDEDGGPPFLRFEPEAQELFDRWRDALENQKLRASEESPLIESHLAKYRKLMPAMALLFHLAESVDSGGAGPVSLGVAELAVSWCELLEAHARRVYACVAEPDLESARALTERIKAGSLTSPFTFRDVYRRCWSQLDEPQAVRRAVAVMEELGWLQSIETPETGGAPRVDIYIHPKLPRKESES